MSDIDRLLATPAGLALANACFNEGVTHALRAVRESEETGVFRKPCSPYFREWAKANRKDTIQ